MRTRRCSARVLAASLAATLVATPVAFGQTVQVCPETSDPQTWAGTTLETDTVRDGTSYDVDSAHLELDRAGGVFRSTSMSVSDTFVYTASADFDNDGWTDFVGTGEGSGYIRVFENRTYENPEPNWADPNDIREPKFVMVRELQAANGVYQRRPTVAADFNGDGWPDVFVAEANAERRPTTARLWLNRASNDSYGRARFNSAYTAVSSPSQLGYQNWGGSNIKAYDWNGDRKLDILIGSGENNGEIRVFLNQCTLMNPQPAPVPAAPAPLRCSNSPTFTWGATLITNLGTGTNQSGGLPVFDYGLVDGDGYPDLVVGAPRLGSNSSTRLRLFKGRAGNTLDTANPQALQFVGAATGVMLGDYSLDGKLDLIVTSDNWHYQSNVVGGMAHYYRNNGTATPFSGAPTQRLTDHNDPTYDYDCGFAFDYDHDPEGTLDVMVADGNHTASYYILANRVLEYYVDCGEAASGVMDLGDLADSEMVVTAARIDPDHTLNGGSITYYLSNEEPPNWVQATDCGDGSGDLCATFPKSSGREVRWKAVMCSNSSHTATPVIRGIDAEFDFARADEHYRSGVVVNDGVSYVGAFRQPGDRGRFYAINAGLNQTYWEAAAKLDAMDDGQRRIYTAHKDTGERLEFGYSGSVDVGLIATMDAADDDQARQLIDWVRGPRFGVGNAGIDLSRLGAVETSTPAVLSRPVLPTWYVFADSEQRTKIDEFITAQADRPTLVLFGSKDGMVHAVHSRPTTITDPINGREAWAFIPPEVASGFVRDYSNSLAGSLDVTAYPDGSPTLADVTDATGEVSTIAIVAGGNGGRSIAALDVTETVDPENVATVYGPTPLWSDVPGGSAAGQAFAKVAVARVRIAGESRFVAIAGTGPAFDDLTPPFESGRIVAGYDALTGEELWKFQTRCPLTSDITTFETDDDLEPGPPRIDGYVDRAVFADRCGYVYKLDPGVDLDGGWNANEGLGAIEVDEVDGVQLYALFATATTTQALGEDSPITGTIGAQIEAGTGRLVLFFGTGGLESHPVDAENEFYGVYADDGSVRAKIAGECTAGRCEKFYGGVVVTQQQVLFTRTIDPRVASGTCDRGSSVIQAVQLNELEDGQFVTDFETTVDSAVMGALYGDAGAVYFATLSGDVVRIGQPRAAEAGGDSAGGGSGSGSGSGSEVGTIDTPMTLMGWRQVF